MRIKNRKAKRKRNKKIIYSLLTIVWFLVIGKVGWDIGYNKSGVVKNVSLKENDVIDNEVKEVADSNKEESVLVEEENEETKVEEEQVAKIEVSEEDNFYINESEQVDNNTENYDELDENTWVDITEEIYHEEIGHWEDVLISPESVKLVPVYARKELSICNGCGADITINPMAHIESRRKSGYLECNGYHAEWREEQVDTREEIIPAVYNKVWVVDKEAWTETKIVGKERI